MGTAGQDGARGTGDRGTGSPTNPYRLAAVTVEARLPTKGNTPSATPISDEDRGIAHKAPKRPPGPQRVSFERGSTIFSHVPKSNSRGNQDALGAKGAVDLANPPPVGSRLVVRRGPDVGTDGRQHAVPSAMQEVRGTRDRSIDTGANASAPRLRQAASDPAKRRDGQAQSSRSPRLADRFGATTRAAEEGVLGLEDFLLTNDGGATFHALPKLTDADVRKLVDGNRIVPASPVPGPGSLEAGVWNALASSVTGLVTLPLRVWLLSAPSPDGERFSKRALSGLDRFENRFRVKLHTKTDREAAQLVEKVITYGTALVGAAQLVRGGIMTLLRLGSRAPLVAGLASEQVAAVKQVAKVFDPIAATSERDLLKLAEARLSAAVATGDPVANAAQGVARFEPLFDVDITLTPEAEGQLAAQARKGAKAAGTHPPSWALDPVSQQGWERIRITELSGHEAELFAEVMNARKVLIGRSSNIAGRAGYVTFDELLLANAERWGKFQQRWQDVYNFALFMRTSSGLPVEVISGAGFTLGEVSAVRKGAALSKVAILPFWP